MKLQRFFFKFFFILITGFFGFNTAINADVTLALNSSKTVATTGEENHYFVELTAPSGDAVTNVQVKIVLPSSATFVSATGPGTYSNATGIWSVNGTPLTSATLDIRVTVNASQLGQQSIASATITSITPSSVGGVGTTDIAPVFVGNTITNWSTLTMNGGSNVNLNNASYTEDFAGQGSAVTFLGSDVGGGTSLFRLTNLATVGNVLNIRFINKPPQGLIDGYGQITNFLPGARTDTTIFFDSSTYPNGITSPAVALYDIDMGTDNVVEAVIVFGLDVYGNMVSPSVLQLASNTTVGQASRNPPTNYATVGPNNPNDPKNRVTYAFVDQTIYGFVIRFWNDKVVSAQEHNVYLSNIYQLQNFSLVAINKSVSSSTATEGSTLSYTITIRNNDTDTMPNVTVTDFLPAGVTYQSSTATQGSYDANSGIWSVGALSASATETLTITVLVNTGTGGQTITNTATVLTTDAYSIDPYETGASSSASFTVTNQADLVIAKTVSNSTPRQGEAISYTITVTNRGTNSINNVTVTDVLPSGVTFQSSSASQGSYNSGTGIWTIGTVAANTTKTLTINVTVSGTAGQLVTNTATVNETDPYALDPYTGNNSAQVSFRVINQSDLVITKSVSNSTPRQGEAIVYTVTVINHGSSGINNVTVTDLLPSGVTFQSSSSTQGSYNNGTGIWTIGFVGANTTKTLTINVTVSGAVGEIVINTATVSENDPYVTDPYFNNNSAQAIFQIIDQANLSITKTVSNSTPVEGESIFYTLTVTNNGPSGINNVSVTDVLPAGVTFQSSSASQGSYDNGTGIWTIGFMPANSAVTLTINVTVSGALGQTVINTATITENDPYVVDPYSGNNSAQAIFQIIDQANLSITKTVSNSTPVEGESIFYTVTVTNNGPSGVNNVSVTDLLPAGVTFQSSVATQGSYNSGTGIWTIGFMPANTSVTLTINVTVSGGVGEAVTNIATINENDPYVVDPYAENNSAQVTFRIINQTDLSITKTVSNSTPMVGESIFYTVTVTNNGPSGVNNVLVTDLLPAGVTFQSSVATQGSYDSGTGIWTVGFMDANTSQALTINVIVTGAAGEIVVNTATVTENDPYVFDPYAGNNTSAQVAFQIINQADLVITKTVSNSTPTEGESIFYTVTVTNRGPSGINNVTVIDLLPAGVTFQSSVASQGSYDNGTGLWTIGFVDANTTVTLTINVMVSGALGEIVINTATVTENDPYVFDPYTGINNSAQVAFQIIDRAHLIITKTVNDNMPMEGDIIFFTITVTNNGPSGVDNVQVSDILPSQVTYQSSVASQGSYSPGTGIWNIGYMPANTVQTLTINVQVNAFTSGTSFFNTALVFENDPYVIDPYNNSHSSSVLITVVFNPYEGVNFVQGGSHLFWKISGLNVNCETSVN